MADAPATKLEPCPACGREVSIMAKQCPNCGHPLATTPTGAERLADVKRVGAAVSIVLVALTLGIQTFFLKLIEDKSAGIGTMIQVFLQTAPFTLAVMAVALAGFKKAIQGPMDLIWMSSVALIGSLLFGTFVGGAAMPDMEGGVIPVMIGSLKFYWTQYGPSLFVSSLILGVFLAWSIARLWPQKATAI